MHIELSPAFAEDQKMLLGFRRKGVWKSEDGGASWDRSWDGPLDYVTDLKISPDFPNDGTAFAAFRGSGVYVTRNGATSWQAVNTGFDYFAGFKRTQSPNHFIDPPLFRAITDVVLAVSPQYAMDSTVFAGSAEGLFLSTDGGQAWQKLSIVTPLIRNSVSGLGISPKYGIDRTIIVSVKGKGLYLSTDAGKSFEPTGVDLLQDNVELKYIRFSPTFQSDNTIHGASEWDLYTSVDKGATWAVIERPIRYEDWRGTYPGPVWFTGDWVRETGGSFSASTQTATERPGARATLNFHGNAISWFGERGPSGGMARVVIDGVEVGIADLYSEINSPSSKIFTISDLKDMPHNVVIEALDDKNPSSTGRRVTVDNIDVLRLRND